jgi:hypothetical protein
MAAAMDPPTQRKVVACNNGHALLLLVKAKASVLTKNLQKEVCL